MNRKQSRFIKIAIGVTVYGALMMFRETLATPWHRIVVAAGAGSVLGLMLIPRKPRPQTPHQ